MEFGGNESPLPCVSVFVRHSVVGKEWKGTQGVPSGKRMYQNNVMEVNECSGVQENKGFRTIQLETTHGQVTPESSSSLLVSNATESIPVGSIGCRHGFQEP